MICLDACIHSIPKRLHSYYMYQHGYFARRRTRIGGGRSVYLSWAKSLGAAHWDAQWARWKTGAALEVVGDDWSGLTYILQRSPRWPCRRSRSGLLPVGRTRRSGAWGRGIPWIRRILDEVVSYGSVCSGAALWLCRMRWTSC